MATQSRVDINPTTAVVEWQCNSEARFLATPDPANSRIQLKIRLVPTPLRTMFALFELLVPVKLKDLSGTTTIYLRICPASITSFEYSSITPVSKAIKQKFDSATLCLNFQLNKNPTILIPTSVGEPVVPARPRSGTVLDGLRQLSRATSLNIHIKDVAVPNHVLHSITEAVNQRHIEPFAKHDDDISRMYGGHGAKTTTLPEATPPPYTEDGPPAPPSAPAHDRKRARRSTDDEHDSISQIWAEIRTIHERDSTRMTAMEALQQENRELRADRDALRAELTSLERSHQELKESHHELENRVVKLQEELNEREDVQIRDIGRAG